MKTIDLNDGHVAIVDDADFASLSCYRWHLSDSGYAVRTEQRDGYRHTVRMHRVIVSAPDSLDVDHINRVKLDNRRSNLRLATRSQNRLNVSGHSDAQVPYKGVRFRADRGTYTATISVNHARHHLGTFQTADDAARAYDVASKAMCGEFAYLNFPQAQV